MTHLVNTRAAYGFTYLPTARAVKQYKALTAAGALLAAISGPKRTLSPASSGRLKL
jgi:hypothetical protein